ncbi:putative protein crowded nuclei [Helianthus annuus]|uniref:Uncharacterized protein n=1 Tax=Helianthus annuus TaxID=4232 RepID=A0A251TWN3_HELAN|nr:putative protein crowded nuclei [Helianthus annuus]KAJ0542821.1 putative protein crowded nuclei [Helianthus annuus]
MVKIEKSLHGMRAESAEAKVAAEVKLVDAWTMMDDAIKRMTEANSKMQAAESTKILTSKILHLYFVWAIEVTVCSLYRIGYVTKHKEFK